MSETAIHLESVRKDFGDFTALSEVSFMTEPLVG